MLWLGHPVKINIFRFVCKNATAILHCERHLIVDDLDFSGNHITHLQRTDWLIHWLNAHV